MDIIKKTFGRVWAAWGLLMFALTMIVFFIPFLCFCSVDDGFPVVKFHFENSLVLAVYPNEYLFKIRVSTIFFLLIHFMIHKHVSLEC